MTNLLTTRIRYAHIVVALITVGVVFGAIAPAFAHPHPDNNNGVVIQTQNDDLQEEAEDQTEETQTATVAVAQTSTRATWNPCTTSPIDPLGLSQAPLESAFDCERFKIDLGYTPPTLPSATAPTTDKTFTGEAWGDFRLQVQCTNRTFKTPRQRFNITNFSLYGRSVDRIASDFSVYADLKALDLWREVLLERVASYTVPKLQTGGEWAGCSTTLIEERVYLPYWSRLMGTQWRWECNPTSESCGSWAQQRTKRLMQISKDRNQQTQDQTTQDEDKTVADTTDEQDESEEEEDAFDGDPEPGETDKEDGDKEETDDTDKQDADKDETKKDGDKDKKDKDQSVKITQKQWEKIQSPKGTYVQSATPKTTTTTKTTKLTKSAKKIIVVTTTTKRTTTRTTTTTQKTTKVTPSKAIVVSEKVTKNVQTTVEPAVVTQTVTEEVQPTTTTVTQTKTKTQTQTHTIQPKTKTKSQRSSVTKINKRGGIIIIISGGRK